MKEIMLVNVAIANKLFAAGVTLITNDRIVDGNKVFVFQYGPDKQAIVNRILNGK